LHDLVKVNATLAAGEVAGVLAGVGDDFGFLEAGVGARE